MPSHSQIFLATLLLERGGLELGLLGLLTGAVDCVSSSGLEDSALARSCISYELRRAFGCDTASKCEQASESTC